MYHYGTFGALLVVLVWSLFKLITDFSIDRLMMLVLVVAVVFATFYARAFAVRAQDRVIRLEEQMRLVRLLPEQLHARIGELSVAQLIALRLPPMRSFRISSGECWTSGWPTPTRSSERSRVGGPITSGSETQAEVGPK
jgi:hypothetical protein